MDISLSVHLLVELLLLLLLLIMVLCSSQGCAVSLQLIQHMIR